MSFCGDKPCPKHRMSHEQVQPRCGQAPFFLPAVPHGVEALFKWHNGSFTGLFFTIEAVPPNQEREVARPKASRVVVLSFSLTFHQLHSPESEILVQQGKAGHKTDNSKSLPKENSFVIVLGEV
jgi:hypothetical protein